MNTLWPLWSAALLLLLLTLGVLLWPLLHEPATEISVDAQARLRRLYRQQRNELERECEAKTISAEDYVQAVEELERRLLTEIDEFTSQSLAGASGAWRRSIPAALLSLLLPLSAVLLYLQVGDPRAAATIALGSPDSHANTGVDVEAMVARLEVRLQNNPDDVEGWIVLARSREVLEEFDASTVAYQRAVTLAKQQGLPATFQARLHADMADALASARHGALDKPVQAVLNVALRLDPDQPKALALAGAAAFREGDRVTAHRHWQHLLGLLEPDSDMALRVQNDLARLDETKQAAVKSALGNGLAGTIRLDPALRDQVQPGDTVFIVARAPKNGRMPVAVLKLKAAQLPTTFTLDDSNAMSPDMPLSKFDTLTIEARISRSGAALSQPGEPVSPPQTVSRGDSSIALTIKP